MKKRSPALDSSDWYKEGEGQLHFFPRPKRLVWTVAKRIIAEAEAWGGEEPQPGIDYGRMQPRPTTPGNYVIDGRGVYRTPTWPLSRIRWGTPLKLDPSNRHVLYKAGHGSTGWRRVEDLIPGQTIKEITKTFYRLFPPQSMYDMDGDGIPDIWVFNDFGPWAIRYFPDSNRNRRRDPGEVLSGEMIHTTPPNEGEAMKGESVKLFASHGCIHIKPFDRDKFLALGAFKKGNPIVVHGPSEIVPEFLTR